MNIVFLTTVLPGERSTGGEVASQAIVDALRQTARVAVIGYRRPGSHPERHEDDEAAGERPIETSAAGARAAGWMASALARRLPYSAAKYMSRGYRVLAQRRCGDMQADLVIVDHGQSGWVDPSRWSSGPLVYVAHNAEHRLYAEGAHQARGARGVLLAREARRMRVLERRLAAQATEVWTLTDADAKSLARLAPTSTRTLTLPGVAPPRGPLPAPDVDIAVLGQWTWEPNERGLRWFLEHVCPLLPATLEVAVGGAGADHLRASHPGVHFAGRVPDALDFLRSARLVAVPATAGGGIQVKTLDAISSGRPVVATPLATRGIGPLPASLRVADSAKTFAAALAAHAETPGQEAAAAEWSRARLQRLANEVCDATAAVTRG